MEETTLLDKALAVFDRYIALGYDRSTAINAAVDLIQDEASDEEEVASICFELGMRLY